MIAQPITTQEQERAMTAVVEAFGEALLVGHSQEEVFDALHDHLQDWEHLITWVTEE